MKYYPIQDLIKEKISGEWGSDVISENSVKVIRTTNFTNEGKLKLDNVVQREIEHKKIIKKKLQYGDIIIEKSGGSPTQPVGRVVFFDIQSEEIYLCNNFTSILRPSEGVHPKYLLYSLFYLHLVGRTLNYQNKTTGIINLQLDRFLKNELIPLPSMENQEQIVMILDEASILRSKRKEAIDLLDDYLKSVFLEMFGDPVGNEKSWRKQGIKSFGKIITGNTPPRNDTINFSSNHIEWIKTDNIIENKTYLSTASEYLSEEGLSKARYVEPGSILVACIAGSIESIGRCAIADRKVSFNQQINAIQPNSTVNTYFLYWLIKISKQYIQSHATNGMKRILTKGNFEKIELIIPPIETQNKFAEVFHKTEILKELMIAQSIENENQFQALMQGAFNDKL